MFNIKKALLHAIAIAAVAVVPFSAGLEGARQPDASTDWSSRDTAVPPEALDPTSATPGNPNQPTFGSRSQANPAYQDEMSPAQRKQWQAPGAKNPMGDQEMQTSGLNVGFYYGRPYYYRPYYYQPYYYHQYYPYYSRPYYYYTW